MNEQTKTQFLWDVSSFSFPSLHHHPPLPNLLLCSLGISLMFIDPETFGQLKVSTGMVHITGKKAAKSAHITLTVLKRHGITNKTCSRL